MQSLKLTIAYDGTHYGGWQIQPNRNTVQAELQRALQIIACAPVKTVASGRTDAGVHALGQVVSLVFPKPLPLPTLHRALNSNLPRDIRIRELAEAPTGFHAIRDATRKRYRYEIWNSQLQNLFRRDYLWHIVPRLDIDRMSAALDALKGTHDFAGFQSAGSPRKTTQRTLRAAELTTDPTPDGILIGIELEADGFLYNMARNIVGSLIWIGRNKRSLQWLDEVIEHRDRKLAGMTAPAHALTLQQVWYDHTSFGQVSQLGTPADYSD